MLELLDSIKEIQDEKEEEKELVRKGDLVEEEEVEKEEEKIPESDVDQDPPIKPTKEQLGRFHKVGECRCCNASIYVEEYRASKVVRPTLIYTCEPTMCWASFDERDIKWSPSYVQGGLSVDYKEKEEKK